MQYDENAEKYGYEGEMTPLKCDKLTAYKADVTISVYGTIADAEVYLKDKVDAALSEKDKEIAELKAQKAQAEDDCAYWKTKAQSERHHKYKRCLAMAESCCNQKENCYNRALRKYTKDEADYLVRKSEFWQDWEFRWLELAEKFKEAK